MALAALEEQPFAAEFGDNDDDDDDEEEEAEREQEGDDYEAAAAEAQHSGEPAILNLAMADFLGLATDRRCALSLLLSQRLFVPSQRRLCLLNGCL